ncbi:mannitol dehydrogenase family protein [Pectobacterium wasabiae]|uniref:D-mannonate oxidoreductase n=1 Tax=Pectobacterium wasabiae TaxID=55208 RepID=A0AAW3EIR2_9GAMM|nr:mannitol dehydrogenase family protein [Pectobacterium wasabiae]AOR64064.1 D-mannonate oxidoreductase [Pectobacterium wasabiae CFBP 3304]EJS94462.1 Putative fructuronate reductase [Pectobacterium wasabiae CFBP 3304]KFX08684.1 D-mannonate oxidoreductase [Pectobacterium wasabiae]KGA28711.1 D-mannonate oxidoreductase [Pectobacterium wasabiae]
MALSLKTLLNVKPGTLVPTYARSQLKTRIAHIGFGAFHRAHQAVCADKLAAEQGSDWGYCEINLIGGEQQIEAIRQQDLLWSVSEMADSGWNSRVIGVATCALHAEVEGIEAVLEALSAPDISIVSITVTEKGYCHHPATGQLNSEHPLICHDLALPAEPRSLPGVILAAIKRRRERQLPAFSVMSCDNMPENGHVTRNVIVQLAEKQDVELARWIEQHVTFPSTMVDRIVPAITEETLETIQVQLGVADPAGVACEPFFQWVIEDNFVNGRPAWEKTGAELVQDVLPFEEMKLRMLNGSHSFLAYLGYLAGYQHISECMQDDALVAAAHHLMLREQAPTLRTQGVDLAAYADALLDRYRNRALKHRTWQIAMDGSQKLPQRMLDSIRWHLAQGSRFDALSLGVAGWMRYVGGIDEQGQPIEISDPLKEAIAETVQNSMEGESRVAALLTLTAIFGEDLPKDPVFVEAVTQHYLALLEKGVKEMLQAAVW